MIENAIIQKRVCYPRHPPPAHHRCQVVEPTATSAVTRMASINEYSALQVALEAAQAECFVKVKSKL